MNKNFKILSALALAGMTAITSAFMFGCGKSKTSNGGNTIVRLNEVTRSVFYAPMYVAMSQGFFEENGIDIDLQTGEPA